MFILEQFFRSCQIHTMHVLIPVTKSYKENTTVHKSTISYKSAFIKTPELHETDSDSQNSSFC